MKDQKKKVVAYLRISTDSQDIENQKLEIEKYAQARGLTIDEWIEVENSSRKNYQARKIDYLLHELKKGDILIVSELSRIARSMRETHDITEKLFKKHVETHVIKQNLILTDNSITTKVMINAFAMAGEIERDLISQRTRNGLALAKQRGVKLGNPRLPRDNRIKIRNANKFAKKHKKLLESFIKQGLTQREMCEELNKLGIPSRRGKLWYPMSLYRVLKRLGLTTKKKGE